MTPERVEVADRKGEVLAALAELRQHLTERRDRIDRELPKAEKAKEAADKKAEASLDQFRSTGLGLAISMRAIETAKLSGANPREVRRLVAKHVTAEDHSADEYRRRRDAWGPRSGDGPWRACPVGADPVIAANLIREGVHGSYRHDPAVTAIRVRLYRLIPGQRLRTTAVVPASDPLTLTDVISHIASDPTTFSRIQQRLHLSETLLLPHPPAGQD